MSKRPAKTVASDIAYRLGTQGPCVVEVVSEDVIALAANGTAGEYQAEEADFLLDLLRQAYNNGARHARARLKERILREL